MPLSLPAMYRLRRHRLNIVQRIFVLALFVLSLVLQPVLASMADVHATSHDPSGEHSHIYDAHSDTGAPADASDRGDDAPSEGLHLLLHVAHCCGHFATPADPALLDVPIGMLVASAVWREPRLNRNMRRLAPFRPPITA